MHDCMRLFGLTELMARPLAAMTQVRQLTQMLRDPSYAVREMAVTVLGRTGAAGVPGLIAALAGGQPSSVKVAAIQALGMNSATATPAVMALCRCLSDPDAVVRDQAAHTMSKIGGPAMPALTEALRSPDMAMRTAAATAIGRVGGEHAKDMANELRYMASSSPPTSAPAMYASIVRLTGDPAQGVPQLQEFLHSGDPKVRQAAIRAAGELGPAGAPLQEALMGRMVDPSPMVRAEAAKAIVNVAPDSPRTQAVLTNLLNDPHPDARAAAAMVLPTLGTAALPALNAAALKATGQDIGFLRSAIYRIQSLRNPGSFSNAASSATDLAQMSSQLTRR
jgi:HEAT repeat protein